MATEVNPVKILHVDDEPDFADVTAEFLEKENDQFSVVTATDASQGLELIQSRSIDCIVSDYEMPGTDGIEFLETVREKHSDLPFILYTGKGSEEIASEAISAGVTDYLQKKGGTEQYKLLANRVLNAVQRYRSQQRVERSEKRLRATIDALPHLLYVVDGTGTYLLANEALAEFHDTTVEEIEGSHVTDVLNELPAENFLQHLGSVLESGSPSRFSEAFVSDPDGNPHYFQGRLQPYDFGDPDICAVLGIATDQTEMRLRKQELEARAMAIEAATDGIAILDTDNQFTFMNDSYAEIYGYEDSDHLLGKSWRACYHSDEVTEFEQKILPVLNEGGEWHGEMEVTLQTGRTIHQELLLKSLDNSQTVCVVRDITSRKEREKELKRYKILTEAVTDSIGIVNEDGIIQYQNPAMERILGYTSSDLEGEMVFDYIHPDDQDRVFSKFMEHIQREGEITERVEFRMRHADGSWRWLEAEASSQSDSALDGYVITSRDITQRKERERKLRQQNELLEQFASVVSHDLRNPLNVADGRLELARQECESPHLDSLETALDRMERIIDDVLWLAREGREIGETDLVDFQEIVESAWELVSADVQEAELLLDENVDSVVIEADDDRLQQLFENLFKNALDHAGPAATVSVEVLEAGFAVEDDGLGIPPERREKVFETGYTTSDDGIGFGLSIVEQVVEAHGWDIEITEGERGGARFEITGVEFGPV